jgi:hypothetical protein
VRRDLKTLEGDSDAQQFAGGTVEFTEKGCRTPARSHTSQAPGLLPPYRPDSSSACESPFQAEQQAPAGIRPRNQLHGARINLLEAPTNFLQPCIFRVFIDIRVETPSTFPAPWHTRMILRASALLSLRLCAHPRCQPARHSPTHPTNNPFAHRPLPLPSTPAPARAAYPVHVMATDRQIQANRLATPEGEQISSKHAALHRLTSGAIVSSMRQSNEFAVSRRSPDENFQYEPNLSAELEDDHVLQ